MGDKGAKHQPQTKGSHFKKKARRRRLTSGKNGPGAGVDQFNDAVSRTVVGAIGPFNSMGRENRTIHDQPPFSDRISLGG